MNIELDHLGIAVRSLEESLAFFRNSLGLAITGEETVPAESVRVAMLPITNQQVPARIELLEASDESSTVAKFIHKRGPGLHHIALRVDDLRATAKRLSDGGSQLLNEPRCGAGGHEYVFVHPRSTGGVLLELIQK